jgi:hypothetical protein
MEDMSLNTFRAELTKLHEEKALQRNLVCEDPKQKATIRTAKDNNSLKNTSHCCASDQTSTGIYRHLSSEVKKKLFPNF